MTIKCPFCTNRYPKKKKTSLYDHIEREHKSQLQGKSPAQVLFNIRNKKEVGTCIMCGKETQWCEKSEKYERLCSERCREDYRKMFKERMMRKHGKTTLLNDPEMQKKMLGNRKISGVYEWENGYKHTYTGSYEKKFLEFMELLMEWGNPEDIMMPAPKVFDYKYDGKPRFYIPDVWIQSLDLYIEIKSEENKHYRLRDIDQEKVKDKLIPADKYLKLSDNNFELFIAYLIKRKEVSN